MTKPEYRMTSGWRGRRRSELVVRHSLVIRHSDFVIPKARLVIRAPSRYNPAPTLIP